MIEKDKQLFWDYEHPKRMDCFEGRLDLPVEDTSKKAILGIDMACPNEQNRVAKWDEKIGKYY